MGATGSSAHVSVQVAGDDGRSVRLVVRVREGQTQTEHEVTVARNFLARLAPNEAPESFVQRSFAFLLEREPKESILRRFDVAVIGRYFPEFEEVIRA